MGSCPGMRRRERSGAPWLLLALLLLLFPALHPAVRNFLAFGTRWVRVARHQSSSISQRHRACLRRPTQKLAVAAVPSSAFPTIDEAEDVGYNLLFEDALEEFEESCVAAIKPFPDYAKGDFVIPSVGMFEMGERKFVGFLDCFGKMQRFRIDGDKVYGTYRMMESAFFNQSKQSNTIGPGLLFFETEPPREKPWYNPICDMPPFAPNDNTYVNTMLVGQELLSVTDSFTMLRVDPSSMRVLGTHEFRDDLQDLVCYTGSAHPLKNPRTGDWIDFVGNADLFSPKTTISMYALGAGEPRRRRRIADVGMETAPYIHSFGVTENYAVLPRMPVQFRAQKVAFEPMAAAFEALDLDQSGDVNNNAFYIVPLNGSEPMVRALPADELLWFVHVVNAYENATGIVIDLTQQPQNPFASNLTIAAARDKAARDLGARYPKGFVKRFLLPWDADAPVTTEDLSDLQSMTDFPIINPNVHARQHCFFWAVEWFADSATYASMAIVKYDVCTGTSKMTWSRKNWYPSEARMVPSNVEGAAEDEGLLVFVALDGATGQTFLLGVDARTMETVSEAGPFPRVGFTTHGQFYPAGSFN